MNLCVVEDEREVLSLFRGKWLLGHRCPIVRDRLPKPPLVLAVDTTISRFQLFVLEGRNASNVLRPRDVEMERHVEIAFVRRAALPVSVYEIQAGARSARACCAVWIHHRDGIDKPVVAASGVGGIAGNLRLLRFRFVCYMCRDHVEAEERGTGESGIKPLSSSVKPTVSSLPTTSSS